MSFLLRLDLPTELIPPLDRFLSDLALSLGSEVEVDDATAQALKGPSDPPTDCPWPTPSPQLYVWGDSTRGARLHLSQQPGVTQVRLTVPALASWSDWEIGIRAGMQLADLVTSGAQLEGEGSFLSAGLRQHFLDDDQRYEQELAEGARAMRAVLDGGEWVRLGGPAGTALVGPTTWARWVEEAPESDWGPRICEGLLNSISPRGMENYHEANPLTFEGKNGVCIVAALLPPATALIFRDPEFILVSTDLEGNDSPQMYAMPFEDLPVALPGHLTWLDEGTCAMAAVGPEAWPHVFERIRAYSTTLAGLLDGDSLGFPSQLQAQRSEASKPRWKFW